MILWTRSNQYRGVQHSHGDLCEAKFPLSTEEADADDRKPIDDADEAILSALNESPFVSVRQFS
jgi:hypothetical protein